MNPDYLQRLWVVTKIWLIAVIVNTLLGALYLAGFSSKYETFWEYIKLGISWGAAFSFPVMITLLLTLRSCMESNKTGKGILRTVYLWGICVTVLMFLLFCFAISFNLPSVLIVLLGIAILSGAVGIASQYRSLLKCGIDFKTTKEYGHEN